MSEGGGPVGESRPAEERPLSGAQAAPPPRHTRAGRGDQSGNPGRLRSGPQREDDSPPTASGKGPIQLNMSKTSTELAFETIIGTFKKNGYLQGGFYEIQQAELVTVINLEFAHWLTKPKDPNAVQKITQELSDNPDLMITFGKCMDYLTRLAVVTQDQLMK